jgi:hypothetical protein
MSSLWDIVKTVGTGIISNVVPGGAALMGVVNEFLPDGAKLPINATGEQVQDAISKIPAEDRAAVMDKQFDVELTTIRESHSTLRTMLESDAANPQSTRPYIAKHAFHIIAITSIAIMAAWSYAVYSGKTDMVEQIQDGAIFVVALNGTLATLLLAYFGSIRKEHKQKMDAAGGVTQPTGIAGVISSFMKR